MWFGSWIIGGGGGVVAGGLGEIMLVSGLAEGT